MYSFFLQECIAIEEKCQHVGNLYSLRLTRFQLFQMTFFHQILSSKLPLAQLAVGLLHPHLGQLLCHVEGCYWNFHQ
jgi:hypothetical protein